MNSINAPTSHSQNSELRKNKIFHHSIKCSEKSYYNAAGYTIITFGYSSALRHTRARQNEKKIQIGRPQTFIVFFSRSSPRRRLSGTSPI